MSAITRLAILLVLLSATKSAEPLAAQSDERVKVLELAAPDAVSANNFGLIFGVRYLPNGGVLVNDGQRHQLSLLNAKLGDQTILAGSESVGGRSYGSSAMALIPYLADSTMLVDRESNSLVVIDPSGVVKGVVAAPVPSQIINVNGRGTGADAVGNLVYRLDELWSPGVPNDTASIRRSLSGPDSFYVVRASFERRGTLDTVGRVRLAVTSRVTVALDNGNIVAMYFTDPLPTQDDFAVLADGNIAFVRGHDYHVDLLHSNGTRESGPKLPFDWKRLSDADKQHLIDSARTRKREQLAAISKMTSNRAIGATSGISVKSEGGLNGGAPPPAPENKINSKYDFFAVNEVADYYPPIRSGALHPDSDNNLWILPTTSAQSKNGELIYDVVNNHGQLIHRVRVPKDRSIAGFGRGGVVFLMFRTVEGWKLERTHISPA